jgi:hypothetical protein
MDGLRLVFPPAAAAILCFPVNNLPLVLLWMFTNFRCSENKLPVFVLYRDVGGYPMGFVGQLV